MPSEKFRITTNGQSLRNSSNTFFDMTLSANLTLDESSDVSAHNDRRSAHNALERQRREHLNSQFQKLAHALPSLKAVRRPSKAIIVSRSLEFVSSSLKRESEFLSEIEKLRLENAKLQRQAEICVKKQEDKEQLSPPPTPKTLHKRPRSSEEPEKPQKKRLVKQERETKAVNYMNMTSFMPSPDNLNTSLHDNLFMNFYDASFSHNLMNPLLMGHFYGPDNLSMIENLNFLS